VYSAYPLGLWHEQAGEASASLPSDWQTNCMPFASARAIAAVAELLLNPDSSESRSGESANAEYPFPSPVMGHSRPQT
jgi:hypothetical protein